MELILYAIPLFFLLIGIELIAEKVRGTNYYRVNDAITSLNTGVLSQISGLLKLLIPFTFYVFLYNNFAFFKVPENTWTWIIAFVAYDFCYYWNHRLGHEMNVLWAAHVVHHSSEDYNLTTALRQTGGSVFSFVFYLPLALFGIEPLMLATVGGLNLIYQYWVHTQHIGKLGWMEWVFVTPSNHRGHHAQNTRYIDRNYGGVFILWDRWFGSYEEESDEDPPVFGIRGALRSWNPLWANFQVYHQLWQDCRRTKNPWHKVSLWFRRTGWRPPDVAAKYPLEKLELEQFKKFDTPLQRGEKVYALSQYLLTFAVTMAVLINLEQLGLSAQLLLFGFIILATFSTGLVLERRRSSAWVETAKYVALVSLVPVFSLSAVASVVVFLFAFANLVALWVLVHPNQRLGLVPLDG